MDTGLFHIVAALTAPLAIQMAFFGAGRREANGSSAGDAGGASRPGGSALDRAKSRVLVNLLNDLRTPLMMIRAPLESDGGVGEEAAEAVLEHATQLQRGLERAIKIIQMDAEAPASDDASPTDLVDALSYFVSSVRPRVERAGVRLAFDSDVRRASVAFDWPRLELLLENVTEYALRGLPEGGKMTFRVASVAGDRVALEVQWDGEFEPVNASAEAVADVGDPLTLGLLLGRRSLRRVGGTLDVVDAGGQASARITLPALELQVAEPDRQSPGTAPAAAPGAPETSVLIVDDHAGTRAYMRFALRKYHRIFEASDGQEALEVVRAEKPDLVISDIMMPVMDGNELCRAIKSDEDLNHIPVFLVTANSIRTLKTESLESGADDFLVKPFDVKEAVMRINNEIEMRKKLRSRYSREVVIKPSDITVTSEDEALINRAREIVEENMANADFSIQDLASEMGLSSRQLQRRLRETLDQSPVEFVRSLRLQRAAQLLGGQYGNVSEVAYAVGFTSLSYFAKCFKEEYGTSPSSYKEERG